MVRPIRILERDRLPLARSGNVAVMAYRQDQLPLRQLGRYALILTIFAGKGMEDHGSFARGGP
jgi:hypothetical protein